MAENTDENVEKVEEESDEVVEEDEVDEVETPVRKSASFYAQRRIIEKQKKQIDKLADKGGADDDQELTPKAQDLIRKELAPIVEGLKVQSDEAELREYLADHPEHKKFEKAARKRMSAWATVPVSEIFKTLTFGVEQVERKEKKDAAIVQAKAKRLGGTSSRAQETPLPSTQAEFKAIYDNVKKNRATIKLGE